METFGQSALSVTSGSQVSLHWATTTDEYFVLRSASPDSLPDFGSPTVVTWPSGSNAAWSSTWQWWSTTSGAVTVAIPASAAPGTTYMLQLYTCSSASGLCSDSSGGAGYAQVALTVAAQWTAINYKQDFRRVETMPQTGGNPLDVAFSGADTIWNTSEFSDAPERVSTSRQCRLPIQLTSPTSHSLIASRLPVPRAAPAPSVSRLCMQARWSGSPKAAGSYFRVGPLPTTPRSSWPMTSRTAGFCTYLVPGNDNEVIGIAITGTGKKTRVWFTESDPVDSLQPSLGSFSPAQVGESCPDDYSLSGAASYEQIVWPQNDLPAEIAVDPNGSDLWVSDLFGSRIEEFDTATGVFTPYAYSSNNTYSPYVGPSRGRSRRNGHYVYAIDYGDDDLVRINKATGTIDQSKLPVTSDTEEGYGLTISGSRLYFSLSDDPRPTFGSVSTNWLHQPRSLGSRVSCMRTRRGLLPQPPRPVSSTPACRLPRTPDPTPIFGELPSIPVARWWLLRTSTRLSACLRSRSRAS